MVVPVEKPSGGVDLDATLTSPNKAAPANLTGKLKEELIDMRTGADGKTYKTAGEAIRYQIGSINENFKDILTVRPGKNIYNLSFNKAGYYDRFDKGIWKNNNAHKCCPVGIKVTPNSKLYYVNTDTNESINVLSYKDDNFVSVNYFEKGTNSYITLSDVDEIKLYTVKAWDGNLAFGYEQFVDGYEPFTEYKYLKGTSIENGTVDKDKLNVEYANYLDESISKINRIDGDFRAGFLYKSINVINEKSMIKGTVNYGTGEIKADDNSNNLITEDFIELPKDIKNLYFISEGAKKHSAFILWYDEMNYLGYNVIELSLPVKSNATRIKFVKHISDPKVCLTFVAVDRFLEYKEELYFKGKIIDELIKESYLDSKIREKLNIGSRAQKYYGKKCVFLGDSIIDGYGMPLSLRIPQLVGELSGMTVYNLGIGGTRGGKHVYENYQAFSFYELANAIASNDYTSQEKQADSVGKSAPNMVKLLKTIDFSAIDYMVISYGTNDWISGNTVDKESQDYTSFYYAMVQGIKTIREIYPKIKILLCTPIFRSAFGTKEQGYSDSHVHNENSLKLTDFVECVKDIGRKCHVPVCDNYYDANIDTYNCETYLSDGTHPFIPDGTGTKLLANRIYSQIMSSF